jgi:quercetin dioxygenase-like cupin family protein
VESFILEPGALAVEPPEVAHAIVALEDTEFLDMTDVSRKNSAYDSDTFRVEIARGPSQGSEA